MSIKSQSFFSLVTPMVYDGSELMKIVNVRTLTILVEYLDSDELIKTEKLVHSYMRSRKLESFRSILNRFLSSKMNSNLEDFQKYFALLNKLDRMDSDIDVAHFYVREVVKLI